MTTGNKLQCATGTKRVQLMYTHLPTVCSRLVEKEGSIVN